MLGPVRALARLTVLGGLAAVGVERMLANQRQGRDPDPIRTFVVIEAPIERVWAELVDIPGQSRWQTEMKDIRILTPGPIGVGTKAEADIRIFGVEVTDPVEVTEFAAPTRFAIRHDGTFHGTGVIELSPSADGRATVVTWDETLVPPLLPELGGLVQRPLLASIFQADLHRFRELLESPTPVAVLADPDPLPPERAEAATSPLAAERAEAAEEAAQQEAAASLAMEAEGAPPTLEEEAEAGLPIDGSTGPRGDAPGQATA